MVPSGKVNDWETSDFGRAPSSGKQVVIVTSRCEVLCLDTEGMANGNDGPYKDEAKYVTSTRKAPVEPANRRRHPVATST